MWRRLPGRTDRFWSHCQKKGLGWTHQIYMGCTHGCSLLGACQGKNLPWDGRMLMRSAASTAAGECALPLKVALLPRAFFSGLSLSFFLQIDDNCTVAREIIPAPPLLNCFTLLFFPPFLCLGSEISYPLNLAFQSTRSIANVVFIEASFS